MTIDMGSQSATRQKNVIVYQNSSGPQPGVAQYVTTNVNKKGIVVKAQDKKLTQNFMKVPRGGAGLIGGNLDGQSYLVK